MKEITIRLTDKEWDEYQRRDNQCILGIKKDMVDEEHVEWMFMIGGCFQPSYILVF
jgi:hypothetical protein